MELFFDRAFTSTIICGDIHGALEKIVYKINEQYKIRNSLIILAGDIGIGFCKPAYYEPIFKKLNSKLKKNNNVLMMLRGNHDDPAYWDNDILPKYHQENNGINLRFLKDYTILNVEDSYYSRRIYCQGGAISIDRLWRLANKQGYWENEVFVLNEDKIKDLEGITDIVTHSAPNFCFPIDKSGIMSWLKEDSNLLFDLNKERDDHAKMYDIIVKKNTIKNYCYGHFHMSKIDFVADTTFKLLDIEELYDLK